MHKFLYPHKIYAKYITSINQFVLYYSNSLNVYQHTNVSNTAVDKRKYFVCNTLLPLSLVFVVIVKEKCANAYISKGYTFLALSRSCVLSLCAT